jgi:cysteine desulfurase
MSTALAEGGANPSSAHALGRRARVILDQARQEIASRIGVKASEVVLTGGGSEADNLAILGSLYSPDARGRHCVTVATEHHAILASVEWAARNGFDITVLPVDAKGHIDRDEFAAALRPDTQVASVMLANNEVGTLHPVRELAVVARERGVWFHTDAVQAYGKIPVNAPGLGVDMLSLAAHKFYGPKGVGVLYVRGGIRLAPTVHGGGQELGRRAGTENIAGAVGTAKAMRLCDEDPAEIERIAKITSEFRKRLTALVDEVQVFGDPDNGLPNTVGAGFAGVDGSTLMMALDLRGICVSTGSACATGASHPSHVLVAMGVEPLFMGGTIRFSFGRGSLPEDAAIIADAVAEEITKIRSASPAPVRS